MGDHNRLIEQAGSGFFVYLASKLGYLCRLTGQHDKGVDAEIELTQSVNALSNKIGIQIKSRSEFRKTKKNEISVTVTEQNLQYWKSYGRPVILVAYSVDEENLYWTRVDNASSRTIKINLDKKFDSSTQQELLEILSRYYADLARNIDLKDVSVILGEIGSNINEVIKPIEKKLVAASNFISEQKFCEAAQIYELLALVYENVFSIWSNWVVCLLFSGELDRALIIAAQLAVKSPENSEAQCLMGICLGTLNNDQEAEAYLSKALELAPTSAAAWTALGLLYHWQDRNKESFEILAKALEYTPNNEFIQFKLALIASMLKDWNASLIHYDKCININPNFYAAFVNRGIVYQELWRIEDAINSYNQAIEIAPEQTQALYRSSDLLKDLGMNQESIRRYCLLLEKYPDSKEIHLNLGMLYCRVNNLSSAAHHFEKYYSGSQSVSQQKQTKKCAVIDMGYEVFFMSEIEFVEGSVRVVSVDSMPKLALHNAMPIMREYMKLASSLNQPPFDREISNNLFMPPYNVYGIN